MTKIPLFLALLIALIPGSTAIQTVVASNTVQYSDLTEISTDSQSYIYGKQITLTNSYQGSMKICFDLMGGLDTDADVTTFGNAQLYLNGAPYGVVKSNHYYSYSTYCDTYSNLNLNAGSDFQVFYSGSQWQTASLKNFKIMFDVTSGQAPQIGLVSDTITVSHSINLCRPYPVEHYDPLYLPEVHDCNNTQIFYLDQYPLNSLPSGGLSNRISPGEMVLLSAMIDNYPGTGYMDLSFYNIDTNTLLFSTHTDLPQCAGNCDWTYWNWFTYAFIGHFGWEINVPGYYNASVSTTWGKATYNFKVESSDPSLQIATTFTSNPTNSYVKVDGVGIGNTPITSVVHEGIHSISFEKPGYDTFIDDYFISSTGHNINAILTQTIINPQNRQISIVRLEGAGSVSSLRNNDFNGVLTQSDSIKTLPYFAGENFSLFAVPSDGYTFDKYCFSSSCDPTIYNNPYTGIILSNFTIYTYFTQQSNTLEIKTRITEQHGTISVYINDMFVGVNSLNMSVYLNKSDSIKFMANPDEGYIFDHCTITGYSCSDGYTFTNLQQNNTYWIYWTLEDNLYNGNSSNPGNTPIRSWSPVYAVPDDDNINVDDYIASHLMLVVAMIGIFGLGIFVVIISKKMYIGCGVITLCLFVLWVFNQVSSAYFYLFLAITAIFVLIER